jgi:hypothetical protein
MSQAFILPLPMDNTQPHSTTLHSTLPVSPPEPPNMGLNDLPYELLAEIVSYVAVAESEELAASALVGHRLICRK